MSSQATFWRECACSLLCCFHFYNSSGLMLTIKITGSGIYHLCCMLTTLLFTPPQGLPHLLGRYLTITPFSPYTAFDSTSYPAHIRAKFAELHDFMESNLATAAHHQKLAYDQHSLPTIYSVGDLVWLSIPTARKLDPRWEGRWKIKLIKSPVNKEITDGLQTKIVHINRLRHHI